MGKTCTIKNVMYLSISYTLILATFKLLLNRELAVCTHSIGSLLAPSGLGGVVVNTWGAYDLPCESDENEHSSENSNSSHTV
jgi:hypothetical protein